MGVCYGAAMQALTGSMLDIAPPSGDVLRWHESALRWRLLYGHWQHDVDARLVEQLGAVKAAAWKRADVSGNPFRSICQQVSTLYDEAPVWSSTMGDAADLAALMDAAGWQQIMQRGQRDCEGQREVFVRADWTVDGLGLRLAHAHRVCARGTASCPDVPVWVREARVRRVGASERWTWDEISIEDEGAPYYRVMDGDKVIEEIPWPDAWRWSDGRPLMPYVVYHAQRTGQMWDAFEGHELVEGTLQVAIQWSMFGHAMLRASWPQRYAVGVDFAGASSEGSASTARQQIVADPATVLLMGKAGDFDGQPLIGQWAAASDPDRLASAVGQYEARMISYSGLSPSDFARTSGDPRSGYALAISSEGQAKASRRRAPAYRRGDRQLARVVAALSSRSGGPHLPDADVWSVTYAIEAAPEVAVVPDVDGAPKAAESAVADTALNGAQVTAVIDVVAAIGDGRLTPDGGAKVLTAAFPAVDPSTIAGIIAGARKPPPSPEPV